MAATLLPSAGSKITQNGLLAENIRQGVSVTICKNSKALFSATGSFPNSCGITQLASGTNSTISAYADRRTMYFATSANNYSSMGIIWYGICNAGQYISFSAGGDRIYIFRVDLG